MTLRRRLCGSIVLACALAERAFSQGEDRGAFREELIHVIVDGLVEVGAGHDLINKAELFRPGR